MFKLREFSLALGVINNILICDQNDRIVFAGDEIKDKLFKSKNKQDLEELLFDNLSDPEEKDGLKEQIAQVRKNKNTWMFKFKDGEKNLFIFPGNYDQNENIILAAEEQFLRANNIESALSERVKEMECLYNISNELERTKDLDEALEKCAGHLTAGVQYPQYTTANIQLDGQLFGDLGCIPGSPRNRLTENIVINNEVRGKIFLCYQKTPDFLEEEKKLLREISLMLSRDLMISKLCSASSLFSFIFFLAPRSVIPFSLTRW